MQILLNECRLSIIISKQLIMKKQRLSRKSSLFFVPENEFLRVKKQMRSSGDITFINNHVFINIIN